MKEIFKKGADENKTKLAKKIMDITDDNLNFKDSYEIEWNIKKLEGRKND